MSTLHGWVTGALLAGGLMLAGCDRGAAPPTEAPAAKAQPVTAAGAPKAGPAAVEPKAGLGAPLPPSDRVFAASIGGQGDLLLGTDGDRLWAARPTAPGSGTVLWQIQGPGVAHKVTAGDLGDGLRIYVAWGVGRGFLAAPLVIDALDPATGARTEIWRDAGERNEAAHLQVADVDRDGAPELGLAYYASKYMVAPRPFEKDGTAAPGAPIRMGSSWLFAELDGAPGPETVIGRVYGDAKGLPGDLRIRTASAEVNVPTDRGVKALMFGAPGGEPPALYFVDGWEADYGKRATARIKRVRLAAGAPVVETIGQSADEFTFFALTEVDVNGDGVTEIAAQGNKRVSLFEKPPSDKPGAGPWTSRPLADIDAVLNTAITRGADGGYTLFVPARPVTRAIPLK